MKCLDDYGELKFSFRGKSFKTSTHVRCYNLAKFGNKQSRGVKTDV